MSAARTFLWCATGVALVGLGVFSFVLPDGVVEISPWWTLLVFLVIGVLFALVSRPRRWWVGLGFAWLLAAWVEAGQAVWMADRGGARLEDVLLGVLGGTIGVAIVVISRRLASQHRSAPVSATAAAAAPRSR